MSVVKKRKKAYYWRIMTFTKAIFAIICVLFTHAIALVFGLYGLWHWFDILMHFGGGLSIGLLALAIWQQGIDEVIFKGWFVKHFKWWLVPIFVIGFVSFVGICWEVFEFVMDLSFLGNLYSVASQSSIADTMLDLVMDLIGASVSLLFYSRK